MYCTKCGNKNEDGAVFCTKCGQRLGILEVQEKHSSRFRNNKKAAFCGLFVILATVMAFILWPRKVNYDSVGTFQPCGLAVAEVKGKYGVCDLKKNEIFPAKYESVEIGEQNEKNALIPVKLDGTMIFLNDKYKKQFKKVEVSAVDGYYLVKKGRKYGIVNEQGDSLVGCAYKKVELQNVYADKAKVKLDGKLNYVSLAGNILYDSAEEENDGCLVKKNKKYGYVAENGEEIIPIEYEKLSVGKRLDNGNIPVEMNGKKNYLDEEGKLLYAEVGEFDENGRAVVRDGDDRYVYIDENGEPITVFRFDDVGAYGKNGLARVKMGEGWGYINYDGLMVVDPIYNEADDFADKSYALVRCGTNYNFISVDGKEKFEYVGEFVGDSAIAKIDHKYVLVDRNGNLLTEKKYDFIYNGEEYWLCGVTYARRNGKYVLIGTDGKELSEYYDEIESSFLFIPEPIKEELAEKLMKDKIIPFRVDQKYGFMDVRGKVIVEPEFSEIEYIPVRDVRENYVVWHAERWLVTFENGEKGVIDQEGNTILRGWYEDIDSDLLYLETVRNGKYGFYTENGDKILDEEYEEIYVYLDDKEESNYIYYIAAEKDGKTILLDSNGNMMTECKYDAIYDVYGGEIIGEVNGKKSVYNLQGEKVLDFSGEAIAFCKKEDFGYIRAANTEGKCGYLDRAGNEIVPLIYDGIWFLSGQNTFEVEINGKQGVMSKELEWVIPAEYDEIYEYDDDTYWVEKDEKYGVFDVNGNVILPVEYDELYPVYSHGFEVESPTFTVCTKDEKKGVLNSEYETLIPIEYGQIFDYIEYEIFVAKSENGIYSLFDKNGQILLEGAWWISNPGMNGLLMVHWPESGGTSDIYDIFGNYRQTIGYMPISGFHNGLAVVEDWETGLQGYVNTQGELVIECQYEDATDFSESSGYADVCMDYENEYWVLIDESGNIVGDSSYRPEE